MKKYFDILLLMVFAFNAYSQQLKCNGQKHPADYLRKSKEQKTTGFILLGAGVAVFTGGAIAMNHSQSKGGHEFPFLVGGLAISLSSVPFYISSISNKRKATLYMKKEALQLMPNIKTGIVYNSTGVKIDL